MRSLVLALTLAILPVSAFAAWGENLGLPPTAPVVDEFKLLGTYELGELERLVRDIKAGSGVEVTVFIPSSLRGREIEDFSISTVEEWKLGKRKEDKGLLITIAPKERKMRIEVGYGLEGELTDAYTRQVLDNVMRPFFRAGRYYDGILAGLIEIQKKVPLGIDETRAAAIHENSSEKTWGQQMLVFVGFLLLMLIVGALQGFAGVSRGRRGGWGGGGWGGRGSSWGGGGSSWGGGGGGFGGGGSSSSW